MKKVLLICLALFSGSAFAQVDVTFKVDMRGWSGPAYSVVNINGTFNGWCGGCNPMTDANNDTIWEVTLPLNPGTIEYKFTLDGWTHQENFNPGEPCTITSGGFTNRVLTFSSAIVLPVNCWNRCTTCPTGPVKLPISLPITWQDSATVNLTTTPFGGCISDLAADPANPAKLALKIIKPLGAELWAGVTLGTPGGFQNNIPFNASANQMQAEFYSPNAGMPIRLKVEDKNDPTKSVETEAVTTTSNAWEILTFNFLNQAPGTAAINYTYNYNKASIFPNFGTDGNTAGEKTFYLGQVAFGTVTSNKNLFSTGDLAIGPNPSNGKFTLRSAALSGKTVKIEITDLAGKTVYMESGIFAGTEKTLNAGKLRDGIYLCRVTSESGTSVQKISIRN